jgi:cyclophilin family peptidyl-prolyl cis-trans isomerase/FKBP-type peptidyl-prolyl cis-trans isomerase
MRGFAVAALGLSLTVAGALAQPQPPALPDAPTLTPRARVDTNLGSFVIRLEGEKAPGTVTNFVQYVQDGFYAGTVFHRVISDFMIQGGGMNRDLNEKSAGLRPPIKNEWRNGLRNDRGAVAMARIGNQPHSARASFFVNVVNNEFLNRPTDGAAYCVFGHVVEGMDTVDRIRQVPVTTDPRFVVDRDRPVVPVDPVIIQSVTLLDKFDRETAEKLAAEFEAHLARTEADIKKQLDEQIAKRIAALEEEHGKKFTKSSTGLLSLDVLEGSGPSPALEGRVQVHYVGSFGDGRVFDDSRKNPDLEGEPADFPVNKVIKGWTEGLLTMKAGGRRILVVPPELGFGSSGRVNIPPDSTLFYDVELLAVLSPERK